MDHQQNILTGLNYEPIRCIVIFAGLEKNIHIETGIATDLAAKEENLDIGGE